MQNELVARVRAYLEALGRDDYETIISLFSPQGRMHSPFLGDMPAVEFFEQLRLATSGSRISPTDIFESNSGARRVMALFRYDWRVIDGSVVSFDCVDLFDFEPAEPLIRKITIICDTHPIREKHGNKYEAAARIRAAAKN